MTREGGKPRLRRAMRALRDGMPQEARQAASQAIAAHLGDWPCYRRAGIVFLYAAMGSEVDTWPMIRRAQMEGKTVCLPRVDGQAMAAVPYRPGDALVKSRYGALEPSPDALPIDPRAIDLILAPALAITRLGARLGYGGGYYDRFLPISGARAAALCFFCQVVDSLPQGMYDVDVDYFIDERGVHDCSEEGSY